MRRTTVGGLLAWCFALRQAAEAKGEDVQGGGGAGGFAVRGRGLESGAPGEGGARGGEGPGRR